MKYLSLGLLLAAGCVVTRHIDPTSASKFYKISDCAQESELNPVRANCSERFANTELSGELEQFTHVRNQPLLHLAIRGSDVIACKLVPPYSEDQLARLQPGDMVTVRGTPTERRIFHSARPDAYSSSMTITFQPCTLVGVKKFIATR